MKRYPRTIKSGSASIKIYRLKHASAASGFVYQVCWTVSGKRHKPQFTDEAEAEEEARLQADKLSSGLAVSGDFTAADRAELLEIRRRSGTTPPLAVIDEWIKASELAGGHLMSAAKLWKETQGKGVINIGVRECGEKFIAEMESLGKHGEAVYRSRLKPAMEQFDQQALDTVSTERWSTFLSQWKNGVTRNDRRKRLLAMCNWAQKNGFIPKGVPPPIAGTLRAAEEDPEIGIATPETLGRLLHLIRNEFSEYLPLTVLAIFCGMRSEELHGRRTNRDNRQQWEDIHTDPERVGGRKPKPYLLVSAAKKNTPSWRHVPLLPVTVEWLALCTPKSKGPICKPAALERVREIGIRRGLELPENCFRHSYITYQIALTGNKHQVSEWAGNSVKKIDKHYRRPTTESVALAWQSLTPARAEKLFRAAPPLPVEQPGNLKSN